MALQNYVSERRLAYFKTKLDAIFATFKVKNVEVNGTELTPDANGTVDVKTPTIKRLTTSDISDTTGYIGLGLIADQSYRIRGENNDTTLEDTFVVVDDSIRAGTGMTPALKVIVRTEAGAYKTANVYSTAAADYLLEAAIQDALTGITGVEFAKVNSVSDLPVTGQKGTFYLVPNTGSGQNVYDEYVWINKGTTADPDYAYEMIGSTAIDLSGYVQESDLVEITEAEIDAMFA